MTEPENDCFNCEDFPECKDPGAQTNEHYCCGKFKPAVAEERGNDIISHYRMGD